MLEGFREWLLGKVSPMARAALAERSIDFKCSFVDLRRLDVLGEVGDATTRMVLYALQNIWRMDDRIYEDILRMALVLLKKEEGAGGVGLDLHIPLL